MDARASSVSAPKGRSPKDRPPTGARFFVSAITVTIEALAIAAVSALLPIALLGAWLVSTGVIR